MSGEQATRPRGPQAAPEDTHPGVLALAGAEAQGLRALIPALRRSRGFLLLWILLTFGPAAAYVAGITPTYRSTALATIDMRELNLGEVSGMLSGTRASTDATIVRTEVQVLQSEGLARKVVADLGLADHPDFAWRPSRRDRMLQGLAGLLGGGMGAAAPQDPAARLAWATEAYLRGLAVVNDGRSFVLQVSFRSTDPRLAATVANRHLALYIEQQRATKREELRNAHAWLEQEVLLLSARVREAEQAVQAYREEHRLFTAGGISAAARMLADMNSQLAAARADLATKEGRLRSSLAGVRRHAADTDVDVTNSATVSRLRDQEATIRRREAELATRLGSHHPDVLAVRAELREIQAKAAEEVQKILTGFGGSTAAAQDRVRELQRGIAGLEQRVVESDRAEAGARDLERIAAATRTLYETLLSRQQQVAAQAGIQRPDAVLVSAAEPPIRPSAPNTLVLLTVALMASGGSGLGVALLRDRLRARVLSVEAAAVAAGLPGLGVLPRAPFGRSIQADVVERPKSAAAEAVRALRSSLVLSRHGGLRPGGAARGAGPRVLAVTSALAGDGKTSTAVALARSMAASGLSVILIDADLRNPAVARMVWGRPAGSPGLGLALAQRLPLDAVLLSDDLTTLRVLHADADPDAPPPQDLLASEAMERLLVEAAQGYDYVIVDTPPAGLVTDAAILGRQVEAILLVTRWNRTPVAALQAAGRSLRAAQAPLAGVVMTDCDPRKLLDHSEGTAYAAPRRHRYFGA